MKKTTFATLVAVAMAIPQLSSGAIILAGWHQFTPNASTVLSQNTPAQEGVNGIYNSINTNLSARQTTGSPGGSIDGWYGPDSEATGGARTEQVIVNPASIPGYVPETAGPGPRLNPGFVDLGIYGGLPANSNFDGRIANANGTDITITNNSVNTYTLTSLVFDAFNRGSAVGLPFTYTIGGVTTTTVEPSIGFTGLNSIGGYGPLVDTAFNGPTSIIPNLSDYGTGTNYVDYVLDLKGAKFAPGDSFTIGFATSGPGTVRLDNIALLAVPEPSSIMALVGLVGSGCFFRRRQKA